MTGCTDVANREPVDGDICLQTSEDEKAVALTGHNHDVRGEQRNNLLINRVRWSSVDKSTEFPKSTGYLGRTEGKLYDEYLGSPEAASYLRFSSYARVRDDRHHFICRPYKTRALDNGIFPHPPANNTEDVMLREVYLNGSYVFRPVTRWKRPESDRETFILCA